MIRRRFVTAASAAAEDTTPKAYPVHPGIEFLGAHHRARLERFLVSKPVIRRAVNLDQFPIPSPPLPQRVDDDVLASLGLPLPVPNHPLPQTFYRDLDAVPLLQFLLR